MKLTRVALRFLELQMHCDVMWRHRENCRVLEKKSDLAKAHWDVPDGDHLGSGLGILLITTTFTCLPHLYI